MIRKIVATFLIFSLLISCETESDSPPNNNDVSVETISYQYLDNGGVILKGRLNNAELMLNYGFRISSVEGGTYEDYTDFEYITGQQNGDYEIEVKNNLLNDQTYYYNAVAYTNNRFILGTEKSFVSKGSSAPKVDYTQPSQAHLGDTITIRGNCFSNNFNVYFNEISSNVLIKSDSLITCVVPYSNNDNQPFDQIKIKKSTGEETVYNDFSLYKPEVFSIEPYEAHETDTLIIKGNHFDTSINRNLVTMNVHGRDSRLDILKSTRTEITIRNAGSFYELFPRLKLTAQLQTIEVNDQLKAKMPNITGVDKECFSYDDTITIYGQNFPRVNWDQFTEDFSLKIGDKYFEARNIYKDSIVLKTNDGYYPDFDLNNIVINYLGEEIVFNTTMCVDEAWIKTSSDNSYITHTFENQLYGIVSRNNQNLITVARFDDEDHKFRSVTGEPVPIEIRATRLLKFNGSKIYSYGFDQNGNNFRSFDFFTNEVTELAPFPGDKRVNGIIETVGDYVYLGLGATETNIFFTDVWRYSISQNSWEFLFDFPGIESYDKAKINPMTFVIGDKIYIGGGQARGYHADFWEYNTQTNNLVKKMNLPVSISGPHKATSMGNKGFFQSFYLCEYDAISDVWKIYNDIIPIIYEYSASMFNYNGVIYRSVSSSSPYYSVLLKLNPQYLDL